MGPIPLPPIDANVTFYGQGWKFNGFVFKRWVIERTEQGYRPHLLDKTAMKSGRLQFQEQNLQETLTGYNTN